jgi:hypothetical protein
LFQGHYGGIHHLFGPDPNHFAICEIMNEFVIIESKKQHKKLFILHLNCNKLETSLLLVPILAMKSPWKISLPWEMQTWTQGGLGQSFTMCL